MAAGTGSSANWGPVGNCEEANLVSRMPAPSINASRIPPMAAEPTMATGPFLAARIAPVMAPLVIEFQGSSFPRTFTKPQSIMEKRPPHTAKLPPSCGALVLMAVKLPLIL